MARAACLAISLAYGMEADFPSNWIRWCLRKCMWSEYHKVGTYHQFPCQISHSQQFPMFRTISFVFLSTTSLSAPSSIPRKFSTSLSQPLFFKLLCLYTWLFTFRNSGRQRCNCTNRARILHLKSYVTFWKKMKTVWQSATNWWRKTAARQHVQHVSTSCCTTCWSRKTFQTCRNFIKPLRRELKPHHSRSNNLRTDGVYSLIAISPLTQLHCRYLVVRSVS